MEFLLFNEILKNLISFPITYQKSWLYNLNIEQILNVAQQVQTSPYLRFCVIKRAHQSQDFNRKILTKSLGKQRCNCGRDHHHFPSTHDLLFLRSLTILYSRPETLESFIGLLNDTQLDRTCKIQYTVKLRVLTRLV